MSLRDSIESIWDIALSNSVLHNTLKIIEPDERWGSLIPEFYGTTVYSTYDTSPPAIEFYRIPRCHRQKHRVTRLEIDRSGKYKYFLETGLITLQDKLVCSFLGWPFTLLEALVCLLAVPAALAAAALLTAIYILAAIPFLLWNHGISYNGIKDLGLVYRFLFAIVPVGLVMAPYRLFQAIFRIPVGIALLIKAKLFGLEEEPLKTAQTLADKTLEQIKALGIEVIDNRIVHQNQPIRSAPASAPKNQFNDGSEGIYQPSLFSNLPAEDIEDSYPIKIPDRYKCPVTLDLIDNPILLNDGYFYNEADIPKIFKSLKSPKTNQLLANENYYPLSSFEQELNAFRNALEAEAKQSEPNYQPILNLAEEAEKTADEIREQITLWIQIYDSVKDQSSKFNKLLKMFKTQESNLYQFLKGQFENSHKVQIKLIAEIAKANNIYDYISKALTIWLFLYPEFRKDIRKDIETPEQLEEAICQKFQSDRTQMIEWFLSLTCESNIPKGMKECLIKALQEAIMETHNFPEKFAALTEECTASSPSLLFGEIGFE